MAYFSKLRRNKSQRKAVLRDLATQFIFEEKLIITEAKAKTLQRIVEKMITLSKKNTPASKRSLISFFRMEIIKNKQTALTKILTNIGPKYQKIQGGYTRIYKTTPRLGDGAPMAIIELV